MRNRKNNFIKKTKNKILFFIRFSFSFGPFNKHLFSFFFFFFIFYTFGSFHLTFMRYNTYFHIVSFSSLLIFIIGT